MNWLTFATSFLKSWVELRYVRMIDFKMTMLIEAEIPFPLRAPVTKMWRVSVKRIRSTNSPPMLWAGTIR